MPLRRKDVLDLDDFGHDEITEVLDTAEAMREVLARPIKRVGALRGKTIVNAFYEPSTRTRLSFELAAKNLSADVVNITATGSSAEKGESLIDTARTLQALGADTVVIRHDASGAPYLVARTLEVSVINAGDGWHAHPTQALLDLFTVRSSFGRLDGLKVVIVGDIQHSRVARSNIWGFTKMGAQVVLCAPPTLLPPRVEEAFALDQRRAAPAEVGASAGGAAPRSAALTSSDLSVAHGLAGGGMRQSGKRAAPATSLLERNSVKAAPFASEVVPGPDGEAGDAAYPVHGAGQGQPVAQRLLSVDYNLDRAVEGADVVMALRIQRERQTGGLFPSLREYARLYQVTRERVARANYHALVMHPGPMNEGVEIAPDVAYSRQSAIEDQVTNGVAIRMALLYLLAGGRRDRIG